MTKLFGALAGVIFLSGCLADPEADMADASMEASMAPELAVNQFIGKPLVNEEGTTFLFNADGTVGGSFRGEDVVGVYESTATEICSSYTAPEALDGLSVCSTPDVTGNQVVFNRRNGSQSDPYFF